MRGVWLSAWKDLLRLRRDPAALALWVGIPLFVVVLMWALFGRSGAAPRGRLLVADEDGSLVSRLAASAFGQGPLGEMLVVEKTARAEGEGRMRRGEASALLVIPKGFGRAVLRGEPCRLRLIKNPAQRILPGIIEETLSMMVEGAFYLQALWGQEMRELAEGPPGGATTFPDATVAQLSVRMNRIGAALGGWLDPPRITLKTEETGKPGAEPVNFAALFAPGMVMLALLFVAQGLGADFWRERENGTLRRALAGPGPRWSLLGGKLAAASAVLFVVSLAGMAGVVWAAGMPAARLLPAAVWSGAAGAAFFLVLALVQLYASSERAAHVRGSLIVYPLVLVGGGLFPLEVMPESLARIGRWTPNGWALVQLKAILAGTAEPGRLALYGAGLAAVGAAAFLLASRRLSRGFAR